MIMNHILTTVFDWVSHGEIFNILYGKTVWDI